MRWIAVVLALAVPGAARAADVLRTNGATIEYRESGGARIALRDVPVIRGSSLQLHAPDWKHGYYSSNSSPRSITFDAQSKTITIAHAADKHVKFTATETYRVLEDGHVEITLRGQLDADVPVQLEWAIGYVNAFALYGGGYVDRWKPGEQPHRVVPQAPAPTPNDQPAVIANTKSIQLNSRMGSITCRVGDDGLRLALLDGRLAPQRWWAQESPTLWLGCLNVPIKPGEPFELRAVIELSARETRSDADTVHIQTHLDRVERVYEPPQRPIQVIPSPKQMKLLDGRFALDDDVKLEDVVNRESDSGLGPEAYSIRCDATGIVVRSSDDAGFRHALHTLRQLVRADPDGTRSIPACAIDDAPSLAFRGVHIFPGKDSLEFHRALIENVIARYKFNHVILECEYTQWDGARGIWVDFSMPKDQIRQYVKMLRDNGLEPIPLVQSLGHMWWMFRNDQNLDLAEDPQMPRAYDATNPKTYEFIDRIYEEALELFGDVKYFHIGHDEITLFGRYPHREESKKWGTTKLFLSDIEHWQRFFEPRGIRIMMWGDMLLAKEEIKDGAAFGDSLAEARARRAALSKDIILCDWHYEALQPDDYPSLRIFKDAGFTTIASTWYNPLNIANFAEAARRNGAWGLLQTTWAGYHLDEGALDRELRQFAGYVLAAEYAWSADSPPPSELPWRADEVLIRSLEDNRGVTRRASAGFTVNLPGAIRLRHILDVGVSGDLGVLRSTDRVEGYKFAVNDTAIVLHGNLLPSAARAPGGASIKVANKVTELAFLHATAFPAEQGEEVGHYEVGYADGSTQRIALRYGIDIRAWDDPAIARNALGAWVGKNDAGVTVAARVLVWSNPHPDKPIERITFATDHPYASPVLFGLSIVESE